MAYTLRLQGRPRVNCLSQSVKEAWELGLGADRQLQSEAGPSRTPECLLGPAAQVVLALITPPYTLEPQDPW